jgi:hypothetical protein
MMRGSYRRTSIALLALATLSAAPDLARAQRGGAAGARVPGDTESIDAVFGRFGRAESAHDTVASERAARALLAHMPSNPLAVFLAARGRALIGDSAGALALLERLAALGDVRPVEEMPDFVNLRPSPHFRRVVARLVENRRPVTAGHVVLTLPDADFLPESFALDTATRAYYVGSLTRRMLVRITPDTAGHVARIDTVAGPADGLLRVVGIELDRARDRLWFATWSPPSDSATSPAERIVHTRLFSYDRASRRLRRYTPGDSLHPHLFNDIVVMPNGDVYVTDTAEGTVWTLRAGSETLQRFTRPQPWSLTSANGITLSGDGRRLYVAFTAGIGAVDLRTHAVHLLPVPRDVTTAGVDGVYWYRGTLVAVQGLGTDERVVRFQLDPAGSRVIGAHVLERGPPVFKRPTTGMIVGDALYYIPDAQYDRLGWDGRLAERSDATKSTIRRLPLGLR